MEHSTAKLSMTFRTCSESSAARLRARGHVAERAVDDRVADVAADGHLANLLFNHPELGDGAAELPALGRVHGRARQSLLGAADVARAELEPAEVQDVEGDAVPLADPAQHVLGGHADVLKDERRRGRAVEPELRLLAPADDAHPALDDEGREPVAADLREDGEEAANRRRDNILTVRT